MLDRHRILIYVTLAGMLLLPACSGEKQQPTPEPAPAEESFVAVVSATGKVVPERWATLSASMPGRIERLAVTEGDWVEGGQVLLTLEGREGLQASLAAAEMELVAAQQALDDLLENAALARAEAQMELATARDELRKADYKWKNQQEGRRASRDVIDAAEANLVLAEEEVKRAKAAYDRLSGRSPDDPSRALALANLAAARQKRDSILRSLNWYKGQPTDIQQAILDAELAMAQERLAAAERRWQAVKDGPDPDALLAARTRLKSAQAQVAAAQAALENIELRAPFAGQVGTLLVRAGEWVAPGQPVLILGDTSALLVETTDLSEIDVAQIEPGATATVTFDALPDAVVQGTVVHIAPKVSEGSGVNFKVLVAMESWPEALRWGMTAFVDIRRGE